MTHKAHTVLDARVTKLHKDKNEFFLETENNNKHGPYNQVYFCIPYPQCKAISQNILNLDQFKEEEGGDRVYDCSWVIMVAFPNGEKVS